MIHIPRRRHDIAVVVLEDVKGRVEFKIEKAGIVHVRIGKVSFEANKLRENGAMLLDSVMKAKPASSKGRYLKSVTVTSTMGPGIALDAVALGKASE